MLYKCSVYGCRTNYKENESDSVIKDDVKLFRFPSDEGERELWIKCLPNLDFVWTASKRICEKHWPVNYEKKVVNRNRNFSPLDPPSIFEGVPTSCVPSQPSKKRYSANSLGTRSKICNENSDVDADLNASFEICPNDISLVTLQDIFNHLKETLCDDFVSISADKVQVSSTDHDGPISKFLILLKTASVDGEYTFFCFNGLLKIRIPFLDKQTVSSISEIEKIIYQTTNS